MWINLSARFIFILLNIFDRIKKSWQYVVGQKIKNLLFKITFEKIEITLCTALVLMNFQNISKFMEKQKKIFFHFQFFLQQKWFNWDKNRWNYRIHKFSCLEKAIVFLNKNILLGLKSKNVVSGISNFQLYKSTFLSIISTHRLIKKNLCMKKIL